jgi:hypothetical protein
MTSNPAGGAAFPTALDQEVVVLIRVSASDLTDMADAFIDRLHRDLVSLSPGIAVSMAGEGWPFCERMAQVVLWVALTDEPPAAIANVLRQVGMANWREGFPDGEYVSMAHALVRAIRDLAEHDWLTSMGSAWISCFQWMQPHLLHGAHQAADDFETRRALGSVQRPPGHLGRLTNGQAPVHGAHVPRRLCRRRERQLRLGHAR